MKWISAKAFNTQQVMVNVDLIESINVSGNGVELHMISDDTYVIECEDHDEANGMLSTILIETSQHSIASIAENTDKLGPILAISKLFMGALVREKNNAEGSTTSDSETGTTETDNSPAEDSR